jgi:hypothetical protein
MNDLQTLFMLIITILLPALFWAIVAIVGLFIIYAVVYKIIDTIRFNRWLRKLKETK